MKPITLKQIKIRDELMMYYQNCGEPNSISNTSSDPYTEVLSNFKTNMERALASYNLEFRQEMNEIKGIAGKLLMSGGFKILPRSVVFPDKIVVNLQGIPLLDMKDMLLQKTEYMY